jgi:hypothetical protein
VVRAWLIAAAFAAAFCGGCQKSIDNAVPGDCLGALDKGGKIVDCTATDATWRLVLKDGPSGLSCPPDTEVLQKTSSDGRSPMEWWCVQSPSAPWPRPTAAAS